MTTPRVLQGFHVLLRIFIGETDKAYGEKLLHFHIAERARHLGLAGCTVFRGISGYGASSIIHKPHLFHFSKDLPVVVEAVDTAENIERLLEEVRPYLNGALVTEEKVRVLHYGHRKEKG